MLAEKEKVVDNDNAKAFHLKTNSSNKEMIIFKNAYHELQKEPQIKDEIYAKVLKFVGGILSDKTNLKPLGN